MQEIERKFLVTSDDFKTQAIRQARIVQGFLNTNPSRTVRVRIYGTQGFITVKGKSNETGMSRFEWEHEISVIEAEELMKLCEPGVIEKIRFEVKSGNHVFEVDEFLDENKGLIVAEVELNSETESFLKPLWLGKEVTGDKKYYNSNLSKHPYSKW